MPAGASPREQLEGYRACSTVIALTELVSATMHTIACFADPAPSSGGEQATERVASVMHQSEPSWQQPTALSQSFPAADPWPTTLGRLRMPPARMTRMKGVQEHVPNQERLG